METANVVGRLGMLTGPNEIRRRVLTALAALGTTSIAGVASPNSAEVRAPNEGVDYGKNTLLPGVRSRVVDNNNGVAMHILEAGFEVPGQRCVVLLHGFPELAYSWRNQLLPLAAAGYHVIAPDLRGCGRSTSAPVKFDDDLLPYTLLNRVSDVVGLVRALGFERVAAVIGHDWGSSTAAWCALVRPDIFQSVVLMSTPFGGPDTLPLNSANIRWTPVANVDIQKTLAALPRPRKHYWWYCATRSANENMWHSRQGVHDLLRAMYYYKSADWPGNKPFALKAWTALELAKMPTYYIMDLDQGIAETMAAHMPSHAQITACQWLTEDDLQVYSAEYIRTGFQGGLNYYRILTDPRFNAELYSFSDRSINVPAMFIGGARDWGVYQSPGVFEGMQHGACTRLLGVHLIDGAGHWMAEERPQQINQLLIDFLHRVAAAPSRA
jgi:pimeloyl-ACP methyl ester carboxylesterase